MSGHTDDYMGMVAWAINEIPCEWIEQLAAELHELRLNHGRLFILGVGGSAANASHAVNDFRKLCRIEAYAPTDNVAELTARANDNGWSTVFADWLRISKLSSKDAIFVLSVGGGSPSVSTCIVEAVRLAVQCEAKVYGIVGKSDGYTANRGDIVISMPEVPPQWLTPITETVQAVIWHCLVNHPVLQLEG